VSEFGGRGSAARQNSEWLEFDLHGYCAIRVQAQCPSAPLLAETFSQFQTEGLDHHDLTVTGDPERVSGGSAFAENDFRYGPRHLTMCRTGEQVIVDGQGWRIHGSGELLVTCVPLIDAIIGKRGATMVHALTVVSNGQGMCVAAWGGSGKTSTMANLMRSGDFAFMGDDWAFVSEQGALLSFWKPMFLKPYHRPLYPHIFATTTKPLVPRRLSKPFAQLTTLAHPVVTQYPGLARRLRRWSPEGIAVRPQQAFPGAQFGTQAPLSVVVFLERTDEALPQLTQCDADWMVPRLVGNFCCELPEHSRELLFALGGTGLVSLHEWIDTKSTIVRASLTNAALFRLTIPKRYPPDHASETALAFLRQLRDRAPARDGAKF